MRASPGDVSICLSHTEARERLSCLRSLLGHGDHPHNSTYPHAPETTILAFETLTGDDAEKDKALLMYDGVRFFYYDSRIQDAFSSGEGSKPGMWHYVFVQVDSDGNGELHVDCELVQTFTTTSRPDPGPMGTLTLCADIDSEGMLSSHFHGTIDELTVFNTSLAPGGVDYEEQTCRSTKFDPVNFEAFNGPGKLAGYFDMTRYDKKECVYTPAPTPESTTPAPTPAPPVISGARRRLAQLWGPEDNLSGPNRRSQGGLMPEGPIHRYNIDYATLECDDVIMPDESGYDRHGRVHSLDTAPLNLRESAPWLVTTPLKSTMKRSNIAGGPNVTLSGAHFAPSKFLSVLLGGDLGVAETIKPMALFADETPEDTLTVLTGVKFPVPKGQCDKSHTVAQVVNFGSDLGTSRLSLPYRPDMHDLVSDVMVYNPFKKSFIGRDYTRASSAMLLLSPAVSESDPSFKPADLMEYTTCLWLRLAFPADTQEALPNIHIGGWKFVCIDSTGAVWLNARRVTDQADLTFWGDLMSAYASTGKPRHLSRPGFVLFVLSQNRCHDLSPPSALIPPRTMSRDGAV